MIEVFVPFVLIFLSWNDNAPSQSMNVTQHVYIDKATCIAAGEEMVELSKADQLARLKEFKVDQVKSERVKYFCVEHSSAIEKYQPAGGQ